ncbi:MAG: hypothetical protein O7D29_01875 [Gemmatimonadetes bacterium]|nr:hypothetical protein [Gemmatimonadota bacterium]
MESRALSIALGAGKLFWVFVFGLFMFFGSAIENGPYQGASAQGARQVGRGLVFFAAVFYAIFHTGFILLARQRRLPVLAWSSFGVTAAPLLAAAALVCSPSYALHLAETVLFPSLSMLLVAFGGSLLMARQTLRSDALTAGVLEFAGGLLGLLFGPTPTILLFIPAWLYKRRVLQAAQCSESLSSRTACGRLSAT